MSTRMARLRVLLELVAGLMTLSLMAASCNPPGATAYTVAETVGRQSLLEFNEGPVKRQVRISIPAGALEGATEGFATLGIRTTTAAPVSAVRFEVGAPAEGEATLDEQGNRGFRFDWSLPDDCDGGCEVVVPVTISHVGGGESPGMSWSMHFTIAYEALVPPAAEDLPDAVIEAADSS